MKVPLKWLREYVDVTIPPEELAHRLTMGGIEVDTITYVGAEWNDVYVGQVLSIERHPNADRLLLVGADYGRGKITVVTGASNFAVGDKVPVALVGARLIDGHSEEPHYVTLQPTKLRGIVSEGMICSEKELGLGEDHSGIMILHPDTRVGEELKDELGDVIFDLKLTPNRSDALSIIGIAREVAALTGGRVRHPEIDVPQEGTPARELASIEVLDPDLAPRYTAMVIHGVKIGPSPRWMQERLTNAGVRPISNIVDVTNYVMLEMGQPLHSFDLGKVAERRVVVRRARPGETIVTLDGVERKLTTEMLLITDPEKAIGLAGVMGGLNTEIDETTKDIILESATFNAINNRRTARALNLPTEASRRFEKGLPPELAVRAVQRAIRLMRELGGGTVAPGVLDAYPEPQAPRQVFLREGEIERLLGMSVPAERVIQILTSLEFEVDPQPGGLLVTVPPHRVDVSLPADLVEEVVRIIGYDLIPDTMLAGELPEQAINEERAWEQVARQTLVGCGLSEIITYALTSRARLRRLLPDATQGQTPSVLVRPDARTEPRVLAGPLPALVDPAYYSGAVEPLLLANPLASESEALRTTAFGSMLETLRDNLRHEDRDVDLFEIGRVYLPTDDKLPDERRVVSIALGGFRSGRRLGERVATDFFDLKGPVEELLARFGVAEPEFVPVVHPVFHPGRAALVVEGEPVAGRDGWPRPDQVLGILGEVRTEVAAAFDVDGQRVYLASLDLGRLIATASRARQYRPLLKYPPVMQDVAVVVDSALPAAGVERAIRATGGELLRAVALFDVYVGDPIPPGKKSLAYSLTYQAADHTLTDEEVKAVHKRIEEVLVRDLGASIRGV